MRPSLVGDGDTVPEWRVPDNWTFVQAGLAPRAIPARLRRGRAREGGRGRGRAGAGFGTLFGSRPAGEGVTVGGQGSRASGHSGSSADGAMPVRCRAGADGRRPPGPTARGTPG